LVSTATTVVSAGPWSTLISSRATLSPVVPGGAMPTLSLLSTLTRLIGAAMRDERLTRSPDLLRLSLHVLELELDLDPFVRLDLQEIRGDLREFEIGLMLVFAFDHAFAVRRPVPAGLLAALLSAIPRSILQPVDRVSPPPPPVRPASVRETFPRSPSTA